ncbi:uncharacterized protein M421DRAFT_1459 [Didymella exigua CBS 183.55]|uniref:Cora-domain-containing protein n=1 Tax=Didymella exigua CBS 183.55 TaxID=1150837 RepID=A0A6A5RZW8_9PLEO|nr:uncharacterized protein M421DRAFT_1459 [Didymella exigua CBS 183.55]KAF1932880.1 hypothetical protein M421DRAFT_1459 [Didymella exigua CBS 183.55]
MDSVSLSCRHPDLEDASFIAWGLEQSSESNGADVEIDVLYGSGCNLLWKRKVDHVKLENVLKLPAPSLRICFINTLATSKSWLPGNFDLPSSTVKVLREAGLSGILLCNLYSQESYWAKMGNQKYLHHNDMGKLDKFEICYQYRCGWDTGVSFTHAIREKQRSTYFCINFPSGARGRLESIYLHESRRAVLHRDFFLDTLVADDSLKQWQIEIGERRSMLLGIEGILEKPSIKEVRNDAPQDKLRPNGNVDTPALSIPENHYNDEERDIGMQPGVSVTSPRRVDTAEYWKYHILKSFGDPGRPEEIDFDKATRQLHKMVRHWLGLRQDCEDLLAQLQFLQKTYNIIRGKRSKDWLCDRGVDAGESFEALISQCDICVRWTQVYHDRTNIRIQLLFHLANQRMAVLNQNIAEVSQQTAIDTALIAEQTQQDSASMITLAAVTMVFLPGTFVCTIVSTNFFDFGDEGLHVSGKWWVLVVVALPLTLIVFGVWWKWRDRRIQKNKRPYASKQKEANPGLT